MSNDCLKLQETPLSKAILTIFYMKMVSTWQIRHLWVASDTTISLHIIMSQSDSQFGPSLSKLRVGMAHYDMKWYCSVARDPQVAYLSRRNHFHVKNGQNGFGKRSFLMFQAIIAHEMTGFPWKCLTVSFPWWEQDSNLLDSNVVLEKPHPRIFEEAGVKHTYLDERS